MSVLRSLLGGRAGLNHVLNPAVPLRGPVTRVRWEAGLPTTHNLHRIMQAKANIPDTREEEKKGQQDNTEIGRAFVLGRTQVMG